MRGQILICITVAKDNTDVWEFIFFWMDLVLTHLKMSQKQ